MNNSLKGTRKVAPISELSASGLIAASNLKLDALNGWSGANQQLDQWKEPNEILGTENQPNELLPPPRPREPFPFAGYLATFSSSVAFATAALCLKLLPVEVSLQEKAKACMIRGMFMVFYSSLAILYRGKPFKLHRDEYLINFLRSLLGSIGMMSNYIALNYISIGESNAITYSSPIWTCLLGFVLLREPLKISMLVALPTSLVGILLLAKPDLVLGPFLAESALEVELAQLDNKTFPLQQQQQRQPQNSSSLLQTTKLIELAELEYYETRLPGILAALTCSVFMAFIIIVLKYRKRTPIETCTFYLGIATVLVSTGLQSIIGFGAMPSSLLECALHFSIGTISYFIQFVFQWALQFVPAGIYSLARSLDIVMGFLFGVVFLQDLVPWTSLAGSALTILVVSIVVLDEYLVRAIKKLLSKSSSSSSSSPSSSVSSRTLSSCGR